MYVGPWQEYKLMKAVESLRERNDRLRWELSGSGDSVASTRSIGAAETERGSSRHFPSDLDNVPPRNTPKRSPRPKCLGVATSLAPRRDSQRGSTTLRLVTRVRDVDVFAEEHPSEASVGLSLRDSAGVGTSPSSSCGGAVDRRASKPLGRKTDGGRGRRGGGGGPHLSKHGRAQGGATATPVHVELGTGKVLRDTPMHTTLHSDRSDESAGLASGGSLGQSKILQEDSSFLRDLLRGGPLDMKTKYQMAGQPLPVPRRLKTSAKDGAIGDKELQERIERRLRLQMLYSGNGAGAEHLFTENRHAVDGGEGDGEEEQQQPRNMGSQADAGKLLPSVPWDIPPLEFQHPPVADGGRPNTLSISSLDVIEGEPAEREYAASSRPHHRRLVHPYDVGAPLAPPIILGTTGSLGESTTPPNVQNIPKEGQGGRCTRVGSGECLGSLSDKRASALDAVFKRNQVVTVPPLSPSLPSSLPLSLQAPAPAPVAESHEGDAGVIRRFAADPLDDDTVGALISWAELLDPDSIL